MKKVTLVLLLFASIACQKKTTELTILHINDTHAKHLSSTRKDKVSGEIMTNGGAAQQATLVKELRAKHSNTLFVHAGDIVTGSVFSLIYKGLESVDILNLLGVDVATLGNHEFDFGVSNTYQMISNQKYISLSANIKDFDTRELVTAPYMLTNIDDTSIAIIGITSEEDVYNVRNKPDGIFIEKEVDTLKQLFKDNSHLKTNDILILLSHVGFESDKLIAKIFPNTFALIVGGHSHTRLEEPVKVGNTLIVQTENNGTSLGELVAKFRGNKIVSFDYNLHRISNIEPDAEVAQYIADKKILVDQKMGGVIGVSEMALDDTGIRLGSLPLGNYVADSVQEKFVDFKPDFSMVNSGSIRAPISEGNITLGSFFELHPFDNLGVLVEISGTDLMKALEHSLSLYDNGGFLQLSKELKVIVKDNKIQEVFVNGEKLDPNKTYRVIVSDWLSKGGDGYQIFTTQKQTPIGADFRDLLIQKVTKNKGIKASEIDSSLRWEFN